MLSSSEDLFPIGQFYEGIRRPSESGEVAGSMISMLQLRPSRSRSSLHRGQGCSKNHDLRQVLLVYLCAVLSMCSS